MWHTKLPAGAIDTNRRPMAALPAAQCEEKAHNSKTPAVVAPTAELTASGTAYCCSCQ